MSKVAFIDSGTGGLAFLFDFIKNLDDKLKKYFKFIHIGDNANVPYGLKTNEQLVVLTKNLIENAIKLDCKIIVIACNTASTVISQEIINEYLKKGIYILPIIEYSASFLYGNAIKYSKNDNLDLAIFATHQTVQSNQYKLAIEKINNNKYNLNIHQYNPNDIEFKIEEDLRNVNIDEMIENVMLEFKEKIGDKAYNNISSIGLFCTHYPILKEKFFYYFRKYSNYKEISNEIFCSQGQIFVQPVIEKINLKIQEENFNKIESYWTAEPNKIPVNIINSILPKDYIIDFKQNF